MEKQVKNEVLAALADKNMDKYLSEVSWLKSEPSETCLQMTNAITNGMLLPIWNEYLAFTEGMANQVYGISIEEFFEEMTSIDLLEGFISYTRGAIEVQKETE